MKPEPLIEDLTRFYWEGAREGELLVQRCDDCAYLQHPPDVACANCLSLALTPVPVSGRATLYSFVIAQRAFSPAFADEVPYVVALVELAERPGLRVLTSVVDAEHADLTIGMELELTFEDRGEWRVPQFRPASAATAAVTS